MEKLNWIKRPWIKNIAIFLAMFAIAHFWQTSNIIKDDPVAMQLRALGSDQWQQVPALDSKVTVVYFFAPWCGICRHSMPNVSKLLTNRQIDQAVFIALDFETEDEVREFAKETVTAGQVFLGTEQMKSAWGISGYPTYAILDSANKIRALNVGYSSYLGLSLRAWWVKHAGS